MHVVRDGVNGHGGDRVGVRMRDRDHRAGKTWLKIMLLKSSWAVSTKGFQTLLGRSTRESTPEDDSDHFEAYVTHTDNNAVLPEDVPAPHPEAAWRLSAPQ